MKKILTLFLLALVLPVVVMAEPVDKDAARLKAEAFFTKQNPSSARRARVQQDIRLALTNESYHVFNLGAEDGFVIISGSDAVERYAHIDLKERFRLMCFAFGEPEYEVDDNLAIIERETVDKVQAILDGLNGDEMERLLEMLKKKKPD